ncbi:MAG: aminopeptidase P N-terminal domain-containing protein [Acidobacteriota bacterium]|nr:aminopeptidase P N-terminal domain-containing protein [Acidobacteriota bacterium]MDQ7087225.1 aminopeptidase P N-terminal domain-containing protein [Acidobacteriota bacterium]
MALKVPPPGVGPEAYARRRRHVMDAIGDGVMILAAGKAPTYSNDTHYRFRPDSNFFFLTGFPEEEAVAVLRPGAPSPYTLFVRPRNEEAEIWTGRRYGPDGAVREFGADAAFEVGALAEKLPDLLDGATTLYYQPWAQRSLDRVVRRSLEALRGKERFGRIAADTLVRPGALLDEMRLIKEPAEIEVLAQACRISATGHLAGMAACRPGCMEFEIQAAIEHAFVREGASGAGYPSIVGAGDSGCILHYIENNRQVAEADLVLVDAGAEFGGYTGDITRTYPASGHFTTAQRQLYEIVLDTLERGIAMARPGETIDGIHEASLRRLSEGLLDLGLLSGSLDEVLEKESYKRYYMHRTSHWLGMDVHDVGRYRKDGACRPLTPGMVFTIEPGLYIQPADPQAPEEFRGLAVRIEDDVLITDDGCRNLTRQVPVDPDAVAALVGQPRP